MALSRYHIWRSSSPSYSIHLEDKASYRISKSNDSGLKAGGAIEDAAKSPNRLESQSRRNREEIEDNEGTQPSVYVIEQEILKQLR